MVKARMMKAALMENGTIPNTLLFPNSQSAERQPDTAARSLSISLAPLGERVASGVVSSRGETGEGVNERFEPLMPPFTEGGKSNSNPLAPVGKSPGARGIVWHLHRPELRAIERSIPPDEQEKQRLLDGHGESHRRAHRCARTGRGGCRGRNRQSQEAGQGGSVPPH